MPENRTKTGRDPKGRIPKGSSGNPGGRPKKTDEERAAEDYLRDKTLLSAKKLVKLTGHKNPKIALGAALGHLKITIGTLERRAGKDGEPLDSHKPLTADELKAVARAQLEKERLRNAPVATRTHSKVGSSQ